MGEKTAIEWTDASWTAVRARNRATGKVGWHCEHVSSGCEHCYSETLNKVYGTGLPFKPGHRKDVDIFLDEKMLMAPLHWRKPKKVFVCSMTDAFADFVKDEWLDRIFAVMALCPQHVFQVLTKRPERMRDYCSDPTTVRRIYTLVCDMVTEDGIAGVLIAPGVDEKLAPPGTRIFLDHWPLRQVWLGISAEDQEASRGHDRRAHPLPLREREMIHRRVGEPLTWADRVRNLTRALQRKPTLAELLLLAPMHQMTPDEINAQRASFVRGMLGRCEHGELDFEQCARCRESLNPPSGSERTT